MANKANKVGSNLVYNDSISYPLSTIGYDLMKDRVVVKNIISGQVLIQFKAGDQINGVAPATVKGIFDELTAFSNGGGNGNGVADIPQGTQKDILSWDTSGKTVAVRINFAHLSDINGMPDFSNGVFVATSINKETGTAFLSFIEFSSGVAKAGTFPNYMANGRLPVGDATQITEAVNLKQLNSRIPAPPVTGNYVLKSANGVVSWVAE